ncbi:hemolysin family protein [Kiloniella sp. b19]|uniref:hemolysin family protein n=1 Tax=Kiloniella sp. GXU_MW_B19 TaxID=3141326 RepID=UPI0031D734B4
MLSSSQTDPEPEPGSPGVSVTDNRVLSPQNASRPEAASGWWSSLKRFFGFRGGESHLRETIGEIIDEIEEQGESEEDITPISADERLMLSNILQLRYLSCSDVMVPRADIIAVDIETPLSELMDRMTEAGHSRMPVYRETLDDAVGMVHIKDVLQFARQQDAEGKSLGDSGLAGSLQSLVRRVLIVAPSMRAMDLLLEMRLSRVHMALIVDEFGGIDGLVTIEDLVEEIVGEIEDEHDTNDGPGLYLRPDGSFIADARCEIEELEDQIGSILSEEEKHEDIDTLGGLVFWLADRVPESGEIIRHDHSDLCFEVLDADARRIKKLRVWNVPPQSPSLMTLAQAGLKPLTTAQQDDSEDARASSSSSEDRG